MRCRDCAYKTNSGNRIESVFVYEWKYPAANMSQLTKNC